MLRNQERYIYGTILCLLKKKKIFKSTCAVQMHVQESTEIGLFFFNLLIHHKVGRSTTGIPGFIHVLIQ